MPLLTLGFNHKTAPLSIRERLALPLQIPLLQSFSNITGAREAAFLATCNRSEIYCQSKNMAAIFDWLAQQSGFTQAELQPYFYMHQSTHAVQHLLRVASGLDSMVLGETQIQHQVKKSFLLAQQAGTIGPLLQRLFQHTFASSRRIRHATALNHHALSIPYLAVQMAKRLFTDIKDCQVLLIGAGETIELVAYHLRGVKSLWIANRTQAHADLLATRYEGKSLALKRIPDIISQCDIVITATHSALPLIGKGLIEEALRKRRRQIMFFLDLAVPRNIEPGIKELPDAYLYNIDDLEALASQNHQAREAAAAQAETMIHMASQEFMQWLDERKNSPHVTHFRQSAEAIRDKTLAQYLKLIDQGEDPATAMKNFARLLTNRLLHEPTLQIRKQTI